MLKIEKDGNESLSIGHKEEIQIFHKSMDLLISSIPNNNNNNNNNNIISNKIENYNNSKKKTDIPIY